MPDEDSGEQIALQLRLVDYVFRGSEAESQLPIPEVPGFVIWSPGLEPLARRIFWEAHAVRTADWGREFYYLERHGPRLYDAAREREREQAEAAARRPAAAGAAEDRADFMEWGRAQYAGVPGSGSWDIPSYETLRFSVSRFHRWWEVMRDPGYRAEAAETFFRTWVDLALGNPEIAARGGHGTTLEGLREFFEAWGLPVVPGDLSTEAIARDLGFDGPIGAS